MEEQNWQEKATALRETAPPPRVGAISSPGNTRHTFPALLQLCSTSGLCNRLRGWVGIGTLADLHRLSFVIHWKPTRTCQSNFRNIFVPDSCALMASHRDRPKFRFLRQYSHKRAVQTTQWFRDRFIGPCDVFWEAAKLRARALKLRPAHQDKLEAFMETVPKGTIGLHVRRTDMHKNRIADPALIAELDRIIAEEPAATFLLCADNPHSVRKLIKRYGERIFWREQAMTAHKRHKHRHTSQIDAAIDAYALARTTRIIGAMYSSFSGYAAFLGGIPIKRV